MNPEILWLDATAQADLVRRGEVSPTELVDAAIAKVEELDPKLNAVVIPTLEKARRQAADPALPDGPFRGVPFLLKDLGGQSEGDPAYAGSKFLRDAKWTEPSDAHFTAKLRAAGFCFLGRTNTPELGLMPTTEPAIFGPSHNPWNLDHSPGGSSGGSAAAVAAGVVSVAHASDGGGSIRIPAANCGLVGLKPTRGRNSFGPGAGERWAGFSAEHVVSRSVRDTAALLDVVSGRMPGDPYAAPPPSATFASFVRPGERRRIGLMTTGPRGMDVHPACAQAAEKAARALEAEGHTVEIAYPEALDDAFAVSAYVTIVASSVRFALSTWAAKVGRPVTAADVEPLTWAMSEAARDYDAVKYIEAVDTVHAFGRRVAAWWEGGFDLLLTPTTGAPPVRLGELRQDPDNPFAPFAGAAPYGAYTLNFNLTGQPGISVPVHTTDDGLPVGAHVVAPFGREDMLIEIAAELEGLLPWADRRPSI
ncbi:MAG: amidase [Candidatus Binatia bacterium]|nr:amidase [Candidatus Binatia bacterium]